MALSDALLDNLLLYWGDTPIEERIKFAEPLEKEIAELQNRRTFPIKITDSAMDSDGVFKDDINGTRIEIHLSVFELDHPFALMAILIHEGRHGKQSERRQHQYKRSEHNNSQAIWKKICLS